MRIWTSYLDEYRRATPAVYFITVAQAKTHAEAVIKSEATREMKVFAPGIVYRWNYIHQTWTEHSHEKVGHE